MTQLDDGRVYLPSAVRKKIAEGREAFDTQFAPSDEMPPAAQIPTPQEAAPPQEQTPESSPPVAGGEGRSEVTQIDDQSGNERHLTPEPPQPEESSFADLQLQLSQANHRFATLQGRYRADMDRQQRQLADAQRQLNEALAQVTALTARVLENNPNTEGNKKVLTAKRKLASITDAERAEFGDGFFDMLVRATEDLVQEEVAARIGQLPSTVEDLTTRLDKSDQHIQLTKQERREQWLDGNVPGWRIQDADPGFMDWLRLDDAFSGVPRINILSHAMERDDFDRIKLIFEGYAKELGVVSPTSLRQLKAARTRLSAQTMPNGGNGRTDAIVPNAPEAPPTAAEVKRYYDRKIRNPKSLSEAEITRMEGRIARGLAAGTIRGVPRV